MNLLDLKFKGMSGRSNVHKKKFEDMTFLSISAISSSKSIVDATWRSLAASFHKPNIALAIPLTLYAFAESELIFKWNDLSVSRNQDAITGI